MQTNTLETKLDESQVDTPRKKGLMRRVGSSIGKYLSVGVLAASLVLSAAPEVEAAPQKSIVSIADQVYDTTSMREKSSKEKEMARKFFIGDDEKKPDDGIYFAVGTVLAGSNPIIESASGKVEWGYLLAITNKICSKMGLGYQVYFTKGNDMASAMHVMEAYMGLHYYQPIKDGFVTMFGIGGLSKFSNKYLDFGSFKPITSPGYYLELMIGRKKENSEGKGSTVSIGYRFSQTNSMQFKARKSDTTTYNFQANEHFLALDVNF